MQPARRSPWVVLAVLCTSVFIIVVDGTIVNVALPTVGPRGAQLPRDGRAEHDRRIPARRIAGLALAAFATATLSWGSLALGPVPLGAFALGPVLPAGALGRALRAVVP